MDVQTLNFSLRFFFQQMYLPYLLCLLQHLLNLEYLFVAIVSNEPDGYENGSGWYYNAELFGRHGLWSNYGSINNCYDPYAFPVLCIPEENCSWNDVRRRERINTKTGGLSTKILRRIYL